MKISGFTIVRNAVQFDYPFLESLQSLLPFVDELVINVGIGDDSTLEQIKLFAQQAEKSHPNKEIRFFESDWQLDNPEKKKGGLILSEQTNLALDQCTGDWCLYLQADEVLHEDDHFNLRKALQHAHPRPEIDGLLFDYIHFYGSYDVIQQTRSAYRREGRMIRKNPGACSHGDAQSFRHVDGSKLNVVRANARVFHYGWVRHPEAMREKTFFFDQLYHGDPTAQNAVQGIPHTGDNYRYKKIWGLTRFRGTHPFSMHTRIQSKNWNWDLKNSPLVWTYADLPKIFLDLFEQATGLRLFEYRSYHLRR